MEEKIIKEIVDEVYKSLPKEKKKEFDVEKIGEQLKEAFYKDMDNIDEEYRIYALNKFKEKVKYQIQGGTMEDISFKNVDGFSKTSNYIISINDEKKIYQLEELLDKCSIKQLNLYNAFYSYTYEVYKVEKINDKKRLISSLKQDIIFSFKNYLTGAKNSEISLFKKFLNAKGITDEAGKDLLQAGYFMAFKTGKDKQLKYIMPKELQDIVKDYNFDETGSSTKDLALQLVEALIVSKGIVSTDEIEEFIMNVADMNIKKDELIKMIDNEFWKKDNYYYDDKLIDNKLFKELVKIKEEKPYMPSYEEVVNTKILIEELADFIRQIAKKDIVVEKIIKTMFYEPKDIDDLIDELSKELKVGNDDKGVLSEFVFYHYLDLPYWINNGEPEEPDDYF